MLLGTESLDSLYQSVISRPPWKLLESDFALSTRIFIIGNGGNLAVADHMAVDITRLSGKLAIAPGSGILATSLIGDSSINDWFINWFKSYTSSDSPDVLASSVIIGVSSSGTASNIVNCLAYAHSLGVKSHLLSSRTIPDHYVPYNNISIGTDFYHTGEVISLLLGYQLIHSAGSVCPRISTSLGSPSFDRLVNPVGH